MENEENIHTISIKEYSIDAEPNKAKKGDGYARITLVTNRSMIKLNTNIGTLEQDIIEYTEKISEETIFKYKENIEE